VTFEELALASLSSVFLISFPSLFPVRVFYGALPLFFLKTIKLIITIEDLESQDDLWIRGHES